MYDVDFLHIMFASCIVERMFIDMMLYIVCSPVIIAKGNCCCVLERSRWNGCRTRGQDLVER